MMPVMAHNLLESIAILNTVSDAFRAKCVEGITAKRKRAQELLARNPSIATALNKSIGYDEAAKVAKEAAANNESVRDVVKRRGLLTEAQLDTILNVRDMTEPGIPGR